VLIIIITRLCLNTTVTPSAGLMLGGVGSACFFPLLRIRPIGLLQFRITSEIINHRHMEGLLGRVISSSQGLYLHRITQHKKTRTNILALSGNRIRDPVYKRSRPAPQTARPLYWRSVWFIRCLEVNSHRRDNLKSNIVHSCVHSCPIRTLSTKYIHLSLVFIIINASIEKNHLRR
jgi:hypothetical protein